MKKPDCFECAHKESIPGDCHIQCNNRKAKVKGHKIGVKGGWFVWPLNFDPRWLVSCDGFEAMKGDK